MDKKVLDTSGGHAHNRPMQSRLRQVQEGRLFIGFIAFSVGVALIGEFVIEWAKAIGGIWGLLVVGGAVMGLVYGWAHRIWRRFAWTPQLSLTGERAVASRVLVVTASPGRKSKSALVAITHHVDRLEQIYVLHTQDDAGRSALNRLTQEAPQSIADQIIAVPINPHGKNDPEVVYIRLESLYQEIRDSGYEEDEVVMDYTGGTRAFAAAMVLLGAAKGRRLQYVTPTNRDEEGHGVEFSTHAAIEIDLRYKIQRDD